MGLTKATGCILLKNMKVIGAYMLAVVGGNKTPDAEAIQTILSSVGIELTAEDNEQLSSLIAICEEKGGIDAVMKEGHEVLKKCPAGGGGGGAGAAGGAAPAAAAAAAEEEEEEEEEAAVDMGGLFGGDDDDY